jgi:hypothetical protein
MTRKLNSDDEFRHQIVERRTFVLAGNEFPCYLLRDGRCVADASDVLRLIVDMEWTAWEYDPDFCASVDEFSEWIDPDEVRSDDEFDDALDPWSELENAIIGSDSD